MKKVIAIIAASIIVIGATGCATWNRMTKGIKSDLGNGLHRTVKVYDAVGNEIGSYSGKFDVDYEDERIMFDDQNGKRHIIYFKTGTVVVDED